MSKQGPTQHPPRGTLWRAPHRTILRFGSELAIAGLCCVLPHAVAAMDAAGAVSGAVDAPITVELTQRPTSAALSDTVAAPDARASFSTATQTTMWAGHGRVTLGLGVERRWRLPAAVQPPEAPSADRDARLLLGVAVRTSESTRLVWQAPSLSSSGAVVPDDDGAARLPLDMRRSDPYRSLVRGSLRMELGRGTTISLKPRGRRIGVALTSQW